MVKKSLSLLLSLLMILSVVIVLPVSAAGGAAFGKTVLWSHDLEKITSALPQAAYLSNNDVFDFQAKHVTNGSATGDSLYYAESTSSMHYMHGTIYLRNGNYMTNALTTGSNPNNDFYRLMYGDYNKSASGGLNLSTKGSSYFYEFDFVWFKPSATKVPLHSANGGYLDAAGNPVLTPLYSEQTAEATYGRFLMMLAGNGTYTPLFYLGGDGSTVSENNSNASVGYIFAGSNCTTVANGYSTVPADDTVYYYDGANKVYLDKGTKLTGTANTNAKYLPKDPEQAYKIDCKARYRIGINIQIRSIQADGQINLRATTYVKPDGASAWEACVGYTDYFYRPTDGRYTGTGTCSASNEKILFAFVTDSGNKAFGGDMEIYKNICDGANHLNVLMTKDATDDTKSNYACIDCGATWQDAPASGDGHTYDSFGRCSTCGEYEWLGWSNQASVIFSPSVTSNTSITMSAPTYDAKTGRIEAPTGGTVTVSTDLVSGTDYSALYAPLSVSFDLTVNEILLNDTSKTLPFPLLNLVSNGTSATTEEILALGATDPSSETVEVMFFQMNDRAASGSLGWAKHVQTSSIYSMELGETYSFFVLIDPVALNAKVYINGEYAGACVLTASQIATTLTQEYQLRFGQNDLKTPYFYNYSLDNVDAAHYNSVVDAYAAIPTNKIFSLRYDRWQVGYSGAKPDLSLEGKIGSTFGAFQWFLPNTTASGYGTLSDSTGVRREITLSGTYGNTTFNLQGRKYEVLLDFALESAASITGDNDVVRIYHADGQKQLRLVSHTADGQYKANGQLLIDRNGKPLTFLRTVTAGVPESTSELRVVVDETTNKYSIYVNGSVAYYVKNGSYLPFVNFPLPGSVSDGTTKDYDYLRLFPAIKKAIVKEVSVSLIPDDNIEFIGSQIRTADHGAAAETFDLRFAFGVDNLYMGDIGFDIAAYKNGVKIGQTQSLVIPAVFKSLNAADGKLQAFHCPEGEYIAAFKIVGIEEIPANYIYTFKITPYTLDGNGNKSLQSSYEVSYTGTGNVPENDDPAVEETGVQYSKILASDDAFVRLGTTYGDKCLNNDRLKNGSLVLKQSINENYSRNVLIRFDDIDASLVSDKNRVCLLLSILTSEMQENGESNPILVYGVSSNWSSDSVTNNTAPKHSEDNFAGIGYPEKTGLCLIDVTDYVLKALKNGARDISFRLMQQHTTPNESETMIVSVSNADATRHPALLFDCWEEGQTYSHVLKENARENEMLWAYAQEMYDDWYDRYQEILARGDFDAEKIQSNPADYTVNTVAHNRIPSAAAVTQKTRLVTTLSDYTPKQREENRYGGDLSAERHAATGRYYTKCIDGRWWIIDPLGYPCYIRGINHLTFSYQGQSSYQKESMLKKYGSAENWALAATRWLQKDYRINVYQNGHSASLDGIENGISRIISANGIAGYGGRYNLLADGESVRVKYNNILPVFDPAFAEYADERVKTEIEPYKNDMTKIFGYTSDNEIAFTDTFLTQYLTLDYTIPALAYSYAVAWNWYKNITGEENPRVEDIDSYSQKLGVDLQDLFLGFVYDRYYNVMSTAVKRNDPAALYLGVRGVTATITSEWYLRFTGYWCDVYCVNYYEYWEADTEALYNVSRLTGKPLLVTEFYAKGMDAVSPKGGSYSNTDGWGWVVNTQTDRGHFYQNFCLRLLESKNCIGWLYFQYIDNDPYVNSSASNKGMVNCEQDTEVYKAFTDQMALVNQNVYSLIEFFDGK